MTWGVYEYHDSVHIVKIDEIEQHYFIECQCGVKYQDGVYVHESLYGDNVDLSGIINHPFGNC